MIYAKLQGRIGNIMFIVAAAASIAKKLNQKYCLACHTDYKLVGGITIWEYVQQFRDNLLSGFDIIPELPSGLPKVKQNGFNYSELEFPDSDFILEGAFQTSKYFDADIVQKLFYNKKILSEIKGNNKEAFSAPITSIHVRRGDYCYIPHRFPPISRSYIRHAMKKFPKGTRFLFISDDMEYCKKYFKGENIYYLENSSILYDLFAPSLCENNVISNSSFTWWGAYLNPHPDKKVIAPTPWFGKYEKVDTSDLVPENWIRLKNHLDPNLWIKAKRMGLLTRLGIIK